MADSEAQINLATIMLAEANLTAVNRIRAIAAEFGAKLPDNFELIHLLQLPEDLFKMIVAKLMSTKCDSLRREEMEMKLLMLPALLLYFTVRPKKVDLTAPLSFCPRQHKYHYLKKSVLNISEVAADIEELSLVHTDRNEPYISDIADDELLEALRKLKRLKVLRIEEICEINLTDLIELCQNLPDLEYLHFCLDNGIEQIDFEELNIAQQLKSAMPKLQVYLFDTSGHASAMNALTKCCAENLPNLRVIQDFSSLFSSFEDFESSNEITCTSGSSNLRHLTVDYDFVESCDHLPSAYPSITHLKILWKPDADAKEKNLTALLELTHLESLELFDVPKDILHNFVEKFGPSLRAIYINYHDEYSESTDYSLCQLSALCPKLERLAIKANFKEEPERSVLFGNLKEIKVEFWSDYNDHIPPIDILQAENLEKITFVECELDFGDLGSLITMIKEKTILRKLKELHYILYSSVQTFDADNFKEKAAFIKCVAASLPDISVITLNIFHEDSFIDYAALARSLANDIRTNEEIDGITQFFENEHISREFIELFVDEELIAILQKYRR
ncbi:Hypothetical predicted protein [Cloeon dipterum]|uniref:F-box domain-containing protein n=1 Tax=Cloeon dipterum TaxID=197152 RepID=A0A8S1DVA4_9INSE|nr:Hypothetical predicted protein [Cloeon dipterum]